MAEKEEDKGFVVKDRRRFSSEDAAEGKEEAKPESGASAVGGEEKEKSAESGPEAGEQQRGPFPEVTLATFVFSLSSSALVHLGEIPEPETNRSQLDLQMAKQIIDTLGMLQEKTKGNLDPDEDRLLRSVLYDLRMRYISKSSGK